MNYKPQTQVNIYMVTFSVNFHHHWQSKLDKKNSQFIVRQQLLSGGEDCFSRELSAYYL